MVSASLSAMCFPNVELYYMHRGHMGNGSQKTHAGAVLQLT